jgi:hypothetical protein
MKKFQKFSIITTAIFLFSYHVCFAQISNNDYRKLIYTRVLSVARSTFEVKGFPSSPDYPSLELRLGVGIVKPVAKLFDLKSGIYLGLKSSNKAEE